MSDRSEKLEAALQERLNAVHVEVEDESHLHAGHAGAREGGGHFRALIVSERFEGLTRVQAQRAVFDAVATEMNEWIHALSLRTLTPSQWDEVS
ncbi:MAG: BolA family transcriptional regulator [Deltaproteobacteria bacterium]|nr:BolA family transcriptional regulator [Deltaproteobacteria bacterium]MBW2394189.1 BolA family transcriptional regulator [Deltaproteobacteria bacterium]